MPHFLESGKVVLQILDRAVAKKEVIDIQDVFFRYTLDAFGLIGFGHPIGSLLKYLSHQQPIVSRPYNFSTSE